MQHPEARLEARHLVDAFDGSAGDMVEDRLEARLDQRLVDEALRLDQVRREIGRIYAEEGK